MGFRTAEADRLLKNCASEGRAYHGSPSYARVKAQMAGPDQLRILRRLALDSSSKLVGKNGESEALTPALRALIAEIAQHMEAGKTVSILAEQNELTTQRAAAMLGVSRPFLVDLLEKAKLPFHMVGTERRLYHADVLAYKTKRDRARHEKISRTTRTQP